MIVLRHTQVSVGQPNKDMFWTDGEVRAKDKDLEIIEL